MEKGAEFTARLQGINMKMMTVIGAAAAALAGVMPHAVAAEASQATLMSEARVSEVQAKSTALKKVPNGSVKSSELEKENGKLVWSFDISQPSAKGVTEVQVDALTGKIVSLKSETPAQEAKEAKAEAKEKARQPVAR